MKTIQRSTVRDQAAAQIKQYIQTNGLAPGDRLPSENELAERFGISRLSVREATKALEFLGIVESRVGIGLAVGRIDLGRMTEHLSFHPQLQAVDPSELIDSRVIVETGVIAHVIRRMAQDASWGERLQAIINRFRATRDLKTWIASDIEFHRTYLEASGLAPMVAFGDLLHVFFQRFRDSVKKAEWKDSIDSHQHLLDLLRAGNVARATAAVREHIESHRERIPMEPNAKS